MEEGENASRKKRKNEGLVNAFSDLGMSHPSGGRDSPDSGSKRVKRKDPSPPSHRASARSQFPDAGGGSVVSPAAPGVDTISDPMSPTKKLRSLWNRIVPRKRSLQESDTLGDLVDMSAFAPAPIPPSTNPQHPNHRTTSDTHHSAGKKSEARSSASRIWEKVKTIGSQIRRSTGSLGRRSTERTPMSLQDEIPHICRQHAESPAEPRRVEEAPTAEMEDSDTASMASTHAPHHSVTAVAPPPSPRLSRRSPKAREWHSDTDSDSDSSPQTAPVMLGQYELMDTREYGRYANVKRVRDPITKQVFAAKTFNKTDKLSADHCMNDLKFSRMCGPHDHIVRSLTLLESNTRAYTIQPLAEQGNLHEYVLDHEWLPSDLPAIRSLFSQLVTTVAHIHSRHVAHRDINPSNILLTFRHVPKSIPRGVPLLLVSDFGSACDVRSTQRPTIAGDMCFCAPEILLHQSRSCDLHRADVWSCGVVLLFLLTGHKPFLGASDSETLCNVLQLSWETIVAPLALPENVRQVLQATLHRTPTHRVDMKTLMQLPFIQAVPSCSEFECTSSLPSDSTNTDTCSSPRQECATQSATFPIFQHALGALRPQDGVEITDLRERTYQRKLKDFEEIRMSAITPIGIHRHSVSALKFVVPGTGEQNQIQWRWHCSKYCVVRGCRCVKVSQIGNSN